MLLSSVQEIREELGFDDMVDINSAITMALNSAEALLGATLRTSFERKTVTDVFMVSEAGYRKGSLIKTEFLLSSGFIVGTPTATSNVRGDISSAFKFISDKGLGRDMVTDYNEEIVEITYDCGFEVEMTAEPDPEPTGSYMLDQVPTWLKQAAKIKALMLLAKLPSVTEAGIELETKMLDHQYASLVNTHIRYAPSALLPE